MKKNRVESFSDGVLAIVITIMVLELETPRVADHSALKALAPALFGYLLSFIYIGIYWSNHHHLFHAVERVDGSVLWANLHLLFWLTLVPFVTAWAGDSRFAGITAAALGAGARFYLGGRSSPGCFLPFRRTTAPSAEGPRRVVALPPNRVRYGTPGHEVAAGGKDGATDAGDSRPERKRRQR